MSRKILDGWPNRPGRFREAMAITRDIQKICEDYRPVVFGPTLDGHRAGPSRWCRQDMSEMWDAGLGPTQSIFRPTSPQPTGRKRRVGDRLASGPGIGMPGEKRAGPMGYPRKRALFGSDGQNSSDVPEGEYSEVAQSSRSPQNDDRTGHGLPSVKLVVAVLQLQKDMEEFRARYGSAGRQSTPVQSSGRSGLTSTPVPRYAGRSSWDQYRHVLKQ